MADLAELLKKVSECTACHLMAENKVLGIPYVPILAKPHAKVVFVGRDPSPRTAKVVGVREGDSVFIQEIFQLADDAGLREDQFYITDLCKCHWRTSSGGNPLPGTEARSPSLDRSVANACLHKWLVNELAILAPSLVVGFGEELYEILKQSINIPNPPLREFSAKADKSAPDAELWFAENGPMTVVLSERHYQLAVIRHPGNSSRLMASDQQDQRREAYERSRARLVKELSLASATEE